MIIYKNKLRTKPIAAIILMSLCCGISYKIKEESNNTIKENKNNWFVDKSFAKSLNGTNIDGKIVEKEKLIIGPELIKRFDYWLTTYGEKTFDEIKEKVYVDLKNELNEQDVIEARRLFNAYFKYKTELSTIKKVQSGTINVTLLRLQVEQLRTIRQKFFTQNEINNLWNNEDLYDDYQLKKMDIKLNKELSEEEKKKELKNLLDNSSENIKNSEINTNINSILMETVNNARMQGATENEIHQIRSKLVGEDAANRLDLLDIEEKKWQEKIEKYQEMIKNSPQEEEKIKNELFTKQEQLRLTAYKK